MLVGLVDGGLTAFMRLPPFIVNSTVSALRAMEMASDGAAEIGIISGGGHINVKSGHHRWTRASPICTAYKAAWNNWRAVTPDSP